MKRTIVLGIVLILLSTFAFGCQSEEPGNNAEVAEQVGSVLWLTPLIETETQDPASIGTPAVFIYPYSIEDMVPYAGAELGPQDFVIATPLYPNFVINDTHLSECDGTVYMVIQVTNMGPYWFQYISLGVSHGTEWMGVTHDERPWIWGADVCPISYEFATDALGPGWSAHIYQEVHPNPDYNEYNIHLTMCAYSDAPDPCMYRYRLHVEDWATATPTLVLMREPFIEILQLALCWVGPGPLYEVVNSIPAGTEVELLGIGPNGEYLVVKEPRYQRACWLPIDMAEELPDDYLRTLEVHAIPILSSPTPVRGSVAGRVFADRDQSGNYTGGDDGIGGAQVSLAPGSCRNPGQAVTTTTGNNGRYSFSNVAPGTYCVTATRPNTCKIFSTNSSYEITVPEGGTVERDFGLDGCR